MLLRIVAAAVEGLVAADQGQEVEVEVEVVAADRSFCLDTPPQRLEFNLQQQLMHLIAPLLPPRSLPSPLPLPPLLWRTTKKPSATRCSRGG